MNCGKKDSRPTEGATRRYIPTGVGLLLLTVLNKTTARAPSSCLTLLRSKVHYNTYKLPNITLYANSVTSVS